MILESIKLRNIRSYTEQTILFPKGSTLIAGDIGSGKSSILHAVEFALFGARREDLSGESLLRKGRHAGDVELAFNVDQKKIIIKRGLKRLKNSVAQDTGYIIIDGKKIEATPVELKAHILNLLGYPKELLTKSKSLVYRYTVYTPQEEMKQIISDPGDVRIDTVRRIFGIDKYKRISENASMYVRGIKESKKLLATVMEGLDEKNREAAAKKEEVSIIEKSRKESLLLLEDARKRKERKRLDLDESEKKIKALSDVKKKMDLCDARLIEIVRSRSRNKTEIEGIDAEIMLVAKNLEKSYEYKELPDADEVEKIIEGNEKKIESFNRRKTEINERLKGLKRNIAELRILFASKSEKLDSLGNRQSLRKSLLDDIKEKDAMLKKVSVAEKKAREMMQEITEFSVKKSESERITRQISSLHICPTCKQEVNEIHKRSVVEKEEESIKGFSFRIDTLMGESKNLQLMLDDHNRKILGLVEKEKNLAVVDSEIKNIESIRSEIEDVKRRRELLELEEARIVSELSDFDDSVVESIRSETMGEKALLKEISSQNIALKEKKHNLAMLAEKKERRERMIGLQEQLKAEVVGINREKMLLAEGLSKISSAEEDFRIAKKEFDVIAEQEKQLEIRLGELNKEIEGINRYIALVEKDVAAKQEAKEEYKRLNSIQEWLEKIFINMMSVMEKQIMARVHAHFSSLFSSWSDMLIDNENISLRIDESFSPVVTQNGYETIIEHLSGGEKTSIALAYRLALNKSINDIMSEIKTQDIIILDEPTDGFSSEQLDRVRDVLEELNSKQVIIVSHESKIESFVDNVIRVHKTDHVSRVVS